MRFDLIALVFALIISSGFTAGITDPPASAEESRRNQSPPAVEPKRPAVGGELVLPLLGEPDSFNPLLSATSFGSAINGHVYATLFEFNERWEPTPYIAETWQVSSDGLTWTIKLRKGIRFHDGSPLTAEDVAFTLNSVKDPAYTGPRAGNLKPVKAVTATDPLTVQIDLYEPYSPILTAINLGILSKDAPASPTPVGAGPYRFVEYRRGEAVVLERNPDWFMSEAHGGAPFIETLQYRIFPSEDAALRAYVRRETDFVSVHPDRMPSVPGWRSTVVEWERNGWGYFTFNTTRAPLNNPLVRQALTYGLDRQRMVEAEFGRMAVVPGGPISRLSWAFDESVKPLPYDPDKARDLLKLAGHTAPLKLTVRSAPSPLAQRIISRAKADWANIGVELSVEFIDFAKLTQQYLATGDFDLAYSGFNLGVDPDQFTLFHSSQTTAFNRARYSNPEVDRLLEEGRRESDPAKRKAIYGQFQRLVVADAPVLLLYTNRYNDFVSERVKGGIVAVPGAGASFVYRWWINEQ